MTSSFSLPLYLSSYSLHFITSLCYFTLLLHFTAIDFASVTFKHCLTQHIHPESVKVGPRMRLLVIALAWWLVYSHAIAEDPGEVQVDSNALDQTRRLRGR